MRAETPVFARRLRTLIAALTLVALGIGEAGAITIVIRNCDGIGEGLNDATPVSPVGGNNGTTRGQQRLNVLNQAAQQWSTLLEGNATVVVDARFDAQQCDSNGATLGSAGPTTVHRNFAGAAFADTWYPAALANARSGTDLNGTPIPGACPLSDVLDGAEIVARFNVLLDTSATCLGGGGWWYGVDRSVPTPANQSALLPVAFHELAHGLGFVSLVDESTGQRLANGIDVFSRFIFDRSVGLTWEGMAANDAQRSASAINDPNLVWNGNNVTQQQTQFLRPPARLTVTAPSNIAGNYAAQLAQYGPAPPPGGLTGQVIDALDASDAAGPSNNDACSPITNPQQVAGRIALVTRGNCNFTVKSRNAQLAGAIGVLVGNNTAGLPPMGGTDNSIAIPSYGISQSDMTTLRVGFGAPGGTVATMGFDTNQPLPGTSGGLVRLHAPNPVDPGSSVSHFTIDAEPNLLMEPNLNGNLFDQVDLTLPLFADIGWQVSVVQQPNQAPSVNAPPSVAVLEDTPTAITGISFADPDAMMGSVRVTLNTSAGTLALADSGGLMVNGGGTGLMTIDGTNGTINAVIANNNLTYTTALDAAGTAALNIQINDNGNTGTGGALSASTSTTLNITATNDAPTVQAAASYAGTEDTPRAINGIAVADVDAGAGTALPLTIVVSQGTLAATTGGGVTVTGSGSGSLVLTGTLAALETFVGGSTNNVIYTPLANFAGPVVLTLTLSDNGNSGAGGTLTGSANSSIVLAAVNDPPTLTAPTSMSALRNGRLDLTAVVPADLDAGSNPVRLTLAVDDGVLSATSGGGVTVTGSPGASIVLAGTLAAIDAFLATGVNYAGSTAAITGTTLTLTLNDDGFTGSGGALTATRNVTLEFELFAIGFE
jgi:hypothetical protein